jgi:preprotein translocase subunit SecA
MGREMLRLIQRNGLRLADLLNFDGGVYKLVYEDVKRQLGDELIEKVRSKPLFRLDSATQEELKDAFGKALARERNRQVILSVVDNLWIRHLTDLDDLRTGIGLRAYGQQDPLIAFKREAHEMYEGLMAAIRHNIARLIFHVSPIRAPEPLPARRMRTKSRASRNKKPGKKVGRNDPCPCGSGKKYKRCCLRARGGGW